MGGAGAAQQQWRQQQAQLAQQLQAPVRQLALAKSPGGPALLLPRRAGAWSSRWGRRCC